MPAATQIIDAELRAADAIHTIDGLDFNAAGHLLGGHRSKESQAQTETDDMILEIELPSDDHVALLAWIGRIEQDKGPLPPETRVLSQNLSA